MSAPVSLISPFESYNSLKNLKLIIWDDKEFRKKLIFVYYVSVYNWVGLLILRLVFCVLLTSREKFEFICNFWISRPDLVFEENYKINLETGYLTV